MLFLAFTVFYFPIGYSVFSTYSFIFLTFSLKLYSPGTIRFSGSKRIDFKLTNSTTTDVKEECEL